MLDVHTPIFMNSTIALWFLGALACLRVALRPGEHPKFDRVAWLAAAGVQLAYAAEYFFVFRYQILFESRRIFYFTVDSPYLIGHKREIQATFIVVSLVALVVAVVRVLYLQRRLALTCKVVWSGLGLSFAWFLLETVSLHSVDQWNYYTEGEMVGALLSTLGCILGVFGIGTTVGRTSKRGETRGRVRGVAPTLSPVVTLACLLYGPLAVPLSWGSWNELDGGLGAALLFAAAGVVGAWAAGFAPMSKLTAYAALFAALGVSFNLTLHPTRRPVTTADILQGMALCGLAVAACRRAFGENVWAESLLAVAPLAAHLMLRPFLPGFPGSQYLIAGPGTSVDNALFPIFPWLTQAVLGARAAKETAAVNLAAASLFGAAAGFLAWSDRGAAGFVKFPMNLPYALLSCAAVGTAFGLAPVVNAWRPMARAARWLSERWLIFFYVHFAVGQAVGLTALPSPWFVWPVVTAASIGGTWLVSSMLGPFSRRFQSLGPWIILLGLIAFAGACPGLPGAAVSGLAGVAGLVFAAQYGTLAFFLANLRTPPSWAILRPHTVETRNDRRSRPNPEVTRSDEPRDPWRDFARLALVLTLLASPEILNVLSRNVSPHSEPPVASPRISKPLPAPTHGGPMD